MGHQKLSEPEISRILFFRLRPSLSDHLHPGVKKPHEEYHKHHIDHMRMKISQHKRIARKFMNGLVTFIYRIISNITGSIREPVAFCFLHTFQFLNHWNHTAIYNIMHISGNGNCNSGCHACHRRKIFFSALHTSVQPVLHHLPYNRKWKYKSKCSYKSTHQIIGNFHSAAREFRKEYCKILSAIVIIDRTF